VFDPSVYECGYVYVCVCARKESNYLLFITIVITITTPTPHYHHIANIVLVDFYFHPSSYVTIAMVNPV